MKNLIAIAAVCAAISTSALAADVTVMGYTEYLAESEGIEAGVGMEFDVSDRFALGSALVVSGPDVDDMELSGLDFAASYTSQSIVGAYTIFAVDEELEHQDTTVGLEFAFDNGLTFSPDVVIEDWDFNVDAVRLTTAYNINETVGVYARVEGDDSFDHQETAFGVSLSF